MSDSIFKANKLSNEQIEAAYENALNQVDAQRLENHINTVMNPEVSQLSEKARLLDEKYAQLLENFNTWKKNSKKQDKEKG